MAKRFAVTKGKAGLIEIDAGAGPKQVTTYTRDGDEVRFSLAGDEGATYTIWKGQEDFDDLAEAFEHAAGAAEKAVEKAHKAAEPGHKTASAA